jgi:NAD+ synthase
MAGGYNPIKDLYKTRVFETSLWRNKNFASWMMGRDGQVIPESIITKPPSAELKFNQRDDDSLPPYEVLDDILEGLLDRDLSVSEIIDIGYDKELVKKIENLIYLSEYKRFQAAPGPNLTDRLLGSSRRYPLVQKWRNKS